jgi:hypothetical protein
LAREHPRTPVTAVLSPNVIDASASLEAASELLRDGPVAVARRGRVVGVVTPDALNRYLRRGLARPQHDPAA